MAKTCLVTKETETEITYHRGDEDGTTCWLCQQHFTTPRRLRAHLPQHFITTFCPCGEFSYHRDYIPRHQRTMNCYQGHLYDVDEAFYHKFLRLIRPLITAPRPITLGPVIKPPGYRRPHTSHFSSEPISCPRTLPRVILQRIDTQPRKHSHTQPRKHSPSSSSPCHSSLAHNLREVEQRTSELEREVHRLAPWISATASELRALRESVARLKRASQD